MKDELAELYDVFEPSYLAPAFERDSSLVGAIFGDLSSADALANPIVQYFLEEGDSSRCEPGLHVCYH